MNIFTEVEAAILAREDQLRRVRLLEETLESAQAILEDLNRSLKSLKHQKGKDLQQALKQAAFDAYAPFLEAGGKITIDKQWALDTSGNEHNHHRHTHSWFVDLMDNAFKQLEKDNA